MDRKIYKETRTIRKGKYHIQMGVDRNWWSVEIMKTECLKSFRGLDNEACSFDEINTACLLTDGS